MLSDLHFRMNASLISYRQYYEYHSMIYIISCGLVGIDTGWHGNVYNVEYRHFTFDYAYIRIEREREERERESVFERIVY